MIGSRKRPIFSTTSCTWRRTVSGEPMRLGNIPGPELKPADFGKALKPFLCGGEPQILLMSCQTARYVGGRQLVAGGQHVDGERIAARYRRTVEALG